MVDNRLPEISTIEPHAVVADGDPAVIIWFTNNTALRYRWDGKDIREETYRNGVVHHSWSVNGSRDELTECAMTILDEYVNVYRDNPDDCKRDWPHVYDMLTVDA